MKVKQNKKNNDILTENRDLKRQNRKLTETIMRFTEDDINMTNTTKNRVNSCLSYMRFLKGIQVDFETGELGDEKKVMVEGYFCENRFCPICSKKKARKDAIRLEAMMNKLEIIDDKSFVFLTLTVPNVSGPELSAKIEEMNNAFNRMSKYKQYVKAIKGSAKKVEVTYNSDKNSPSFNTYHPHFHVLLAVDSNYFSNPHKYISHAKWLAMWQKAMVDDSISQVNVKRADKSAVLEMSKYMAKDSDYLHSDEVFKTFYNALKGKRLLTFSGVFKQGVSDYEDGKLDDYKQQELTRVDSLVRSNWKDTKFDYENEIRSIDDLEDWEYEDIVEKLAHRKRSFDGLFVQYNGRTTIGKEECVTDESDD